MKDEEEVGGRMELADGRDLRERTKRFGLATIRLYSQIPRTAQGQVLGRQVLRSGTSIGAHYREAWRARSDAEFVSKVECGLQELDETGYWLELLIDSGTLSASAAKDLLAESEELIRIFVTIARNAKRP
jgi:four helix bundle protein